MKRRRRALDDLEWEMRDHIEREARELIERGMAPADARDAAIRAFGSTLRATEDAREVWIARWWDQLRQDVTGGVRSISRYPVAALVAVLSLAAGIGGATVTLTVRDAVFRRPPPTYRQPAEISRVQVGSPENPIRPDGGEVPAGVYAEWLPSLGSRLAASGRAVALEIRTGDRSATIPTRAVTASLFDVLGVQPVLGRAFAATPDGDGPTPALLSHRVWQELFDGRADVVGLPLWIDNRSFVVSGVMPERFWYVDTNSPVWTPLDVGRLSPDTPLDVVVRRSGVTTPAMLEAQLHPGLMSHVGRLPVEQRRMRVAVTGIEGTPLGRQVSVALPYILSAAVMLTLLIACVNVAVLLIVQWTARTHEIAIRAAIGASRSRIVRSLLTESVAMAATGGVLGVAAVLALRALALRGGGDSVFYDLSVSPRTFVSTALVAVFAGIAAGLGPALYGTRSLQEHPFRAIGGSARRPQRWTHTLVVLEIAVTVALLIEASALLDGYRRWTRPSMGFDTRPLVVANVQNQGDVPVAKLLETVRALPGGPSAAASTAVPLGARAASVRVAAAPGAEGLAAERPASSSSFFSSLGMPLLAGRPFGENESDSSRAAILGEALASRLFPGGNAIGATVWIGGAPYDVVGIAADYADRPLQPVHVRLRIYTPMPAAARRLAVVVRATDAAALVRPLRRALREAAVGNVVDGVYTVDEIIRAGGQEILTGTAPLLPLISTGLLLTAAGVYGVLAFAVARRRRELAVRVVVGASRRDLVRMVTAQLLILVGAGLGLGIGVTFALSQIVRVTGEAGSVYAPEPVAFAVPVIVVGVLAVVAAWLPARRAAAIDPVILLRAS